MSSNLLGSIGEVVISCELLNLLYSFNQLIMFDAEKIHVRMIHVVH